MCEYSNYPLDIVDIINIMDSKDMILTHCSLAFPHSVFFQLALLGDYVAARLHLSWTLSFGNLSLSIFEICMT